jgi:hypothetical protein
MMDKGGRRVKEMEEAERIFLTFVAEYRMMSLKHI